MPVSGAPIQGLGRAVHHGDPTEIAKELKGPTPTAAALSALRHVLCCCSACSDATAAIYLCKALSVVDLRRHAAEMSPLYWHTSYHAVSLSLPPPQYLTASALGSVNSGALQACCITLFKEAVPSQRKSGWRPTNRCSEAMWNSVGVRQCGSDAVWE